MRKFRIIATWDTDAGIWYVSESNVPGLNAEAATVEELRDELMELIPMLVEANSKTTIKECDVPMELLFQQQAKLKVGRGR